jgi:DUF1680 family protein
MTTVELQQPAMVSGIGHMGNVGSQNKINKVNRHLLGLVIRSLPLGMFLACAGSALPAAESQKGNALMLPESWSAAISDSATVPLWHRADVHQVKLAGEWRRRQVLTGTGILAEQPETILARLNHGNKGNMYLGVGKLVDALARLSAIPGADPQVVQYRQTLLDGIFSAQSKDGYIGGWPTGQLLAKGGQWEVHELSYLILGLCNDYRIHGDRRSLEAAKRAGAYMLNHLQPLKSHCASGWVGLDECLVALEQITKEKTWQEALLTRVAPERWTPADRAPHGHVYEHLGLCVGQMDYCETHPDPQLLLHGLRLLEHLGPGGGLLITGSTSHKEHVDTSHGSDVIVETCVTAYLVRTLGRLFELIGDLRCHDILERTVNNALFAAQTPDGKTIRYFTRHEGERNPNGPYVCCKMNFRRTVGELGEYVAYTGQNGVAVCQYGPGQLTLALAAGGNVRLEMETAYPHDGNVLIRVRPDQPRAFALRLRIPRWCKDAKLQVDNEPAIGNLKGGEFTVVTRTWTGKETVRLELPLTWRWIAGRAKQTGKAALLRGPLVYHLDPARSNLAGIPLENVVPESTSLPASVPAGSLPTDEWLVHVKGHGTDAAAGKTAELVFIPYADSAGRRLWFNLPGEEDELH